MTFKSQEQYQNISEKVPMCWIFPGWLWWWRWRPWSPKGVYQLGRRRAPWLHLLWTQISTWPQGCCCGSLVLSHPTMCTCSLEPNRAPFEYSKILKSVGIFRTERWCEAECWFHDSQFASFRTESSFLSNPCCYLGPKMFLSVNDSCQVVAFLLSEDSREEKTGMKDSGV